MLKPGDHVGEMSLIDDQQHSACVRAETVVETAGAGAGSVCQTACRPAPACPTPILRALSQRLRAANRQITTLALVDVYGRVARALLDMAQEIDGHSVINHRGLARQALQGGGCVVARDDRPRAQEPGAPAAPSCCDTMVRCCWGTGCRRLQSTAAEPAARTRAPAPGPPGTRRHVDGLLTERCQQPRRNMSSPVNQLWSRSCNTRNITPSTGSKSRYATSTARRPSTKHCWPRRCARESMGPHTLAVFGYDETGVGRLPAGRSRRARTFRQRQSGLPERQALVGRSAGPRGGRWWPHHHAQGAVAWRHGLFCRHVTDTEGNRVGLHALG